MVNLSLFLNIFYILKLSKKRISYVEKTTYKREKANEAKRETNAGMAAGSNSNVQWKSIYGAGRNPFTSQDKIIYTSSNKKIATVDAYGKVKGIRTGRAVITVRSGSASCRCTVNVVK